jgi:hypothetical protein
MRQGIQDPDTIRQILFGGTPLFTGLEVIDENTFTEIGERDPVAFYDHIVLWVPARQEELGRRRAYGILHQRRRKFDNSLFSVDKGPGPIENFQRLFVLYEEAGIPHHFKGGEVNLVELVPGKHIDAQASAEPLAGVKVSFQ